MIRRGGILMEAVVALMLLSLLLLSTGQILSLMYRQSRLLSQRAVALQECHNAMAKVASLDAKEMSVGSLTAIKLPSSAVEILPEGELKIVHEPPFQGQEGTEVKATVRWRPAPNADFAETTLSLWRFDLAQQGAASGDVP